MKFLAAIFLVVAAVHANSLHSYGWTPGKESVFRFESQILTGIPEIGESQRSGIKLTSKVIVQSYSDYSLRIKMTDSKFITLNGKVQLTESGRVIGDGGSESGKSGHLPEHFKQYLEQPFLVHLKSGVVESFWVSSDEPVSVTNIKKSLLSQLQLDISGSRRTQPESNQIQSQVEEGQISEQTTYFTTSEESIQGECLTTYTVHKLPQWKINELEENWTREERLVKGLQSESVESVLEVSESAEGKRHCEQKPYYMIVRTKNFDQCKTRPVFQKWTGVEGNCDISSAHCGSAMNTIATTTTFVCGELNQFYIRKVNVQNIVKANPVGYATDEQTTVASQINMELLTIKSISERLPVPSSTKQIKSLIYAFPEQTSGLTTIPEEIVRESESVLGIRPVLPQPGLTEAPKTLIPITLPKHELMSQILDQLKNMSIKVYKSPESCASHSDIAGSFTSVSEYMRHLSLSELEQLEQQVQEQARSGNNTIEKIFYDALSMVGTNPSTMLVIKKVKSEALPKQRLIKMISYTIRSVRYPTKAILSELVKMVKSETVTSNKDLFSASLVHLSNLFYKAYVEPTTMYNLFPTNVYGVFGTKESRVLTEEYIPFLTQKLESEQQGLRLVIISSLGKLGHMKALKPLLKVVEGKLSEEQVIRSLAVYSLKRVTKRNPAELRPILLSIINNPVELPEVRIAAVAVLPWSQPTAAELQKIAIRSWMEPSKQVSSFIQSTLRYLAITENPEIRSVGLKAKAALPLLKPQKFGIQYSQYIGLSTFIKYMNSLAGQDLSIVNSKDSLTPVRASMKTAYIVDSGIMNYKLADFTVYTQGMDTVLEKYLHYVGHTTEASSTVKSQLSKIASELNLKVRQLESPKAFLQQSIAGIESSLYLDTEILIEALEKASKQIESQRTLEFNHVSATLIYEANTLLMTESGLPVTTTVSKPIVYAIKGSVKSEPSEGKWLPKIAAKIIPVFNAKVQVSTGIISPFTTEFIGTAVEMSVHTSIPIEAKAKITRGQLDLTLKTPTEVQQSGQDTETIHGFVRPYTVRRNLHHVVPMTQSGNKRQIVSGKEMQKIDIPIGQSLGLEGRLIFESDAKFIDLASYVEKIKQNTPTSTILVGLLPSSCRASSTKIQYKPAQSETKEFHILVKLTTKGQMHPLSSGQVNEQELENNGFVNVKQVLSQLEDVSSSATVVELIASRRGPTVSKTLKTAVVIGQKTQQSGQIVKTLAAVDVKPSAGPVFGIQYEGKLQLPKLMNRWSLEQLIQEPLDLKYQSRLVFGKQSGEQQEIKLDATLIKTEKQKESVKESPEYKKCMTEERMGRKLSSVCSVVRRQAASLDKVLVSVQVPRSVAQSPVVTLVGDLLKSALIGQVSEVSTSEVTPSGEQTTLLVEAIADRTSEVAQVKVTTPTETLKIKNLRLLGHTENILPLTVLNRIPSLLAQQVSANQIPSTCSVEPKFINTFDNKTYQYQINDCEHVLLLDGSKKIPVAVLARTVSEEKKVVKILSGITEVEVIPESSSMVVKVNGETVQLTQGQTVVKRTSSGRIIVELKRYSDNVYMINVPSQFLTVLTDGTRIEIAAPQILKSRSVGLCGVYNGETTTDLKTPRMCVMKPKLSAVSYLLNKEGSSTTFPRCSGIPSALKPEFEKESRVCTHEHVVPTPVLGLYKRISSLNKPTVRAHIVKKQFSKTCISKQMVKVCSIQSTTGGFASVSSSQWESKVPSVSGRYLSKPLAIKPKTVEFVCVPRPSSLSQSLEKRALSGEPLYTELEQLQVAFRKVEFEPVACGMPTVEESSSLESIRSQIESGRSF